MNEKIKNYLGGAITVAVLVLSYAAVSYVNSYARVTEPSSFRSFSVSAEGKVVAVPDVAQFTFSVVTEGGKELGGLVGDNTEKVNKAIAFVKSKGVDEKDIKTEAYSIEPRYQYYDCSQPYPLSGDSRPCPPATIVGYTVRQTVLVKAREELFDKAGELLSGVVQNGANTVSQLTFTIDDPTALQSEAREEAIRKAKDKAKAIARAGDFRVGRLLSIDEGGGPIFPRYFGAEVVGKGGADFGAVPVPTVEAGSEEVVISVVLRYEIE